MERINLFENTHKGIRNGFSQLSFLAGNTDYTKPEPVKKLYDLGKDVFLLLNIHAAEEDEMIMAELEKKAPNSTKHDIEEHEAIEAEQQQLEKMLDEIYDGAMNHGDMTVLGNRFYFEINLFYSQYLIHMADEETDTMNMLWENFTDEELAQIRKRSIAQFTPEVAMKWQSFIIPSLSPVQRVAVLKSVKANAPRQSYNAYLRVVEKNLPAEEFADLINKLQ